MFTTGYLLGLAVLLSPPPFHPPHPSPRPSPRPNVKVEVFNNVVNEYFPRWGRRGFIDVEEVRNLMRERSIRGDSAAFLATIHEYQFIHHDDTRITQKVLLDETSKEHEFFRSHYDYYANIVQNAPKELFVGDAPSLDTIHQGQVGDCFVIAPIGAAVARNPRHVREMIHQQGEEGYEVAFPRERVHVAPLTDAEIAITSGAGDSGLWIKVLETAVGKGTRKRRGPESNEAAEDAVDKGGSAEATIRLLTGHEAKYLSFKEPNAEKAASLLEHSLHSGKLVCAETSKEMKVKVPEIANDHDYAVVGYESGAVKVWNPWGNNFEPKGDAGLEHGFPTEHGRFSVPIHDFVKIFEGIVYETDEGEREHTKDRKDRRRD